MLCLGFLQPDLKFRFRINAFVFEYSRFPPTKRQKMLEANNANTVNRKLINYGFLLNYCATYFWADDTRRMYLLYLNETITLNAFIMENGLKIVAIRDK